MLDSRILRSPVLVLVAGLAAAIVAEMLAFSGMGTTRDELSRAAAVGFIASCGAAAMAARMGEPFLKKIELAVQRVGAVAGVPLEPVAYGVFRM